jgi:hypothetical protein
MLREMLEPCRNYNGKEIIHLCSLNFSLDEFIEVVV